MARLEQERQQAIEQSYVRIMQENQTRKKENERLKQSTNGFVSQSTEAPALPAAPLPFRTAVAGEPLPAI